MASPHTLSMREANQRLAAASKGRTGRFLSHDEWIRMLQDGVVEFFRSARFDLSRPGLPALPLKSAGLDMERMVVTLREPTEEELADE